MCLDTSEKQRDQNGVQAVDNELIDESKNKTGELVYVIKGFESVKIPYIYTIYIGGHRPLNLGLSQSIW